MDKLVQLRKIEKLYQLIKKSAQTDYSLKEARAYGKKYYNAIIAFNKHFPNDMIKGDEPSKNDPMDLDLIEPNAIIYENLPHIYGDSLNDLECGFAKSAVDTTMISDFNSDSVVPKIQRCQFLIKKARNKDLKQVRDSVNQYLKNNHINVDKLCDDLTNFCESVYDFPEYTFISSQDFVTYYLSLFTKTLINSGMRAQKSAYKVALHKDYYRINHKWYSNLLHQSVPKDRLQDEKVLANSDRDINSRDQDEYKHLKQFASQAKDIYGKYHHLPLIIVYATNCKIDIRPVTVDDIKHRLANRKKSVNQLQFIHQLKGIQQQYQNNHDINKALTAIRSLSREHARYDFGLPTKFIRKVISKDLVFQKHNLKTTETNGIQSVDDTLSKRALRNEKHILTTLPESEYVNHNLKAYNAKDLSLLFKNLIRYMYTSLFKENADNEDFNPKISVKLAHLAVGVAYDDALYAKEIRYEERADQLIKWLDNHKNAKVSYRNLIPVGHYLYKRNIEAVKKEVSQQVAKI